jgi:siderophore synthetase component/RimJ/RimL family protein N-acetyltransferase
MPTLDDERWNPHRLADWLTVETLLVCYARDLAANAQWDLPRRNFGAWAVWERPPEHDDALRELWQRSIHPRWLRLALHAAGVDIMCPIARSSTAGRPLLSPPVIARSHDTGQVRVLGLGEIAELVMAQYRAEAPLTSRTAEQVMSRLYQSRDILASILAHRRERPPWAGRSWPSFLEAEQAVFAGHPFHPLAKSRWGFTAQEVQRYSPEFAGEFRLHFFLAHPSIVLEDHASGPLELDTLAEELGAHHATPAHVRALLDRHRDWRLLPVHPWEAALLLHDDRVQAAMAAELLVALGPAGAPFAATSSVRTVYRRDLPFMLKLSLHVGITNCERINYLHELRKGCAVARLLATDWGRDFARDVPGLRILPDTGFVTMVWNGEIVDGFSTAVRDNPFRDDSARVAVAAALCEPSTVGHSLLLEIMTMAAAELRLTRANAALVWFDRYLDLLLGSLATAYDRHGMALEVHLQNVLVELDDTSLPVRLYYRDNQGFFFHDAHAPTLLHHVPELADITPCVLPERMLRDPIAYYLFVNNILGFVHAFSNQRLAHEDDLLKVVARRLRAAAAQDSSNFLGQFIDARGWPVKANLRMILEGQDELRRPVETPATYIEVDNPILPLAYVCRDVVAPDTRDVVYTRFCDDYQAAMQLRPLSLDSDLALIHDWVNQPYAREFWCMDGPIRDLEAYYVEMLSSPYAHAFIAHLGAEPAFLLETYWTPRDVVSRHYEVRPDDYGLHLIMAPLRVRRPRFSTRAFQIAAEFLFRHRQVGRLLVEPDRHNLKAARVMQRVGFELDRMVELPDKEASLMLCTRERFLLHCPDSRPYIAPFDALGHVPPAGRHTQTALSMQADER